MHDEAVAAGSRDAPERRWSMFGVANSSGIALLIGFFGLVFGLNFTPRARCRPAGRR